MKRLDSQKFAQFVEGHATQLINDYFVWVLSNGLVLVPFGDFIEIYDSIDEFKSMNPEDPE